ncbi:hypothetical protein G7Y89_g11874 [Cudoniella acicularis]|uniref:Uncharacterized protein n=1 Tax=Cudoniella acicularis TaxID=354080 RepID=A0A8H4RA51_9HELO|nr:hypothetical protein G7Y89_g11874 [Cudoniella acicularis]
MVARIAVGVGEEEGPEKGWEAEDAGDAEDVSEAFGVCSVREIELVFVFLDVDVDVEILEREIRKIGKDFRRDGWRLTLGYLQACRHLGYRMPLLRRLAGLAGRAELAELAGPFLKKVKELFGTVRKSIGKVDESNVFLSGDIIAGSVSVDGLTTDY